MKLPTQKNITSYSSGTRNLYMESAKEMTIVFILVAVAILVGLWLNALGWCLFVAALIWIWIQANEYRKVLAWSKRPLSRPQNGLDSWFTLSYTPFRSLIRERARTRDMASRLRDLLGLSEVIPDGVIVLSPHGDIEGLNQAAKDLMQLSDSDIGLGLATVVRSPDFVNFIRSGQNDEPLDFASPFDQERSFEARRIEVGPRHDGRTIVLVRDITALNRLLTMRQNFVANVSHELRTPLTVVAGYLETMADEEQDDELRLSLIDRLDTPVKRMQSLVDDLMLLTQLESTSADTEARIQLQRVIEAAVNELQGLCKFPEQIQIRCDSNRPILGAEKELHSVCINLLSNAIRYGDSEKPIEISLQDHNDKVRLMVKDEGRGIAPEHLDRITERFYRVDMADAGARGGTGLGLAIVKHVLRRHSSELQVNSALGVGSAFYCDFEPAVREAKEAAEQHAIN